MLINDSDISNADLLADLRLKVLDNILRALLILGGIAAFVSTSEAIGDGDYFLASIYAALYGMLIVVTFSWSLGFAVRATLFQSLIFMLALSEFYFFGIASLGPMFLVGHVVFVGMFFGIKRGALAIFYGLLALAGTAWYYTSGVAPTDRPMHVVSTDIANWPGPVLAFIFLATTALISITLLLRRLDESLQESHVLLDNLKTRIEENEETTRSLQESQALYSLLAEQGSEIIWEADPNQICTYVAPSIKEVLGWSPEDLLGKPVIRTLLPTSDVDYLNDRFAQFVAGEFDNISGEFEYLKKDGGFLWCSMQAVAVRDENGKTQRVQGVVRDISQRKALEEQLLHSQKMKAMGQLAGGVAHDFNNQLGAIVSSAELLSLSKSLSEKEQKSVGVITRCAAAATKLTSQLLSFARKGKTTSIPVDLHEIVKNVEQILSHAVPSRLKVETVIAKRGELPIGDPDQLQNALLNLCINARDAMPEGGTLRIETDYVNREEPLEDGERVLDAGQYFRVRVSDTGTGMDDETQKRIFEPFFTTKGEDKGTGLGLPSVLGCVESHGGWIEVDSRVAEGSTFSIMLPIVPAMHTPSGGVPVVKYVEHNEEVTPSRRN